MKYKKNEFYDLKIRVGKSEKLVQTEKNVQCEGAINSTNGNGNITYQFRRMQQIVGQKETFAVSEALII